MSEKFKSAIDKAKELGKKTKDILFTDIKDIVNNLTPKAKEQAQILAAKIRQLPEGTPQHKNSLEALKGLLNIKTLRIGTIGTLAAFGLATGSASAKSIDQALTASGATAPTEQVQVSDIKIAEASVVIPPVSGGGQVGEDAPKTPSVPADQAPYTASIQQPVTQIASVPTSENITVNTQADPEPPITTTKAPTEVIIKTEPATREPQDGSALNALEPIQENGKYTGIGDGTRTRDTVVNTERAPVAESMTNSQLDVLKKQAREARATNKFTIIAPNEAEVAKSVQASGHFAKGQSERSGKTANQLSSFIPTQGEYELITTILTGKQLGGDPNQLVANPYNLQTKITRGELHKKAIADPNFQEVVRQAYKRGNIEVATHQTTSELTRSFDVLGGVIGLLTGKIAIGFGSKDTGSATTVFRTQETNQYIASATPKSLISDIISLIGQLEEQKSKSTSPEEQKQLTGQITTLSVERNRIEKDQEGVANYIRLHQLKNQGTLSARESSELKALTQNLVGGTKETLPSTGALEYVTQPFGNLKIDTVSYKTRITTSFGSISIDVNSPLARALKNHDPKTPLSNTLLLQISDEMQKQNPNSENFRVIRSVGTSDQINRQIINEKLNNVRVSYTKPGDILPSPDRLSDGQNAMGAVIAIAKSSYLRGDINAGDKTLSYIYDSTGRIHPDAEAFLNIMGVKSSNLSRVTIMSLQVRADNRAGLGDRIRSVSQKVAELERLYQEADSRAMASSDPRDRNHRANLLAKQEAWNNRQVELDKIQAQVTTPPDSAHSDYLLNTLGINTTTTISGQSDGARHREIKIESSRPATSPELIALKDQLKGAKSTVVLDERTSNFFGFQIVDEKYDGQTNTRRVNERNVKVGNLFIEALHAILPVGLSFKTTDKISKSGVTIKTADYASLRDATGALALSQNPGLADKILSYSKSGLSFDLATHRAITDLYGINNNIVKMTVNVNGQRQEINIPLSELPKVIQAYQGVIVKTTFSSPTATTGMPGVQLLGNQVRSISSTTAVDLTPEIRESLKKSSTEAVRSHITRLESTRLESVTQKGSQQGTLTQMYQEFNQAFGTNLPIPTGSLLTKWSVNRGQESLAKVNPQVQVRYNLQQIKAGYNKTGSFKAIFEMIHCNNLGVSIDGTPNLDLALEESLNIRPITTHSTGMDTQESLRGDNTKATATIPKGSESKKPKEPKQPDQPKAPEPVKPRTVLEGNQNINAPTPAVTPPGHAPSIVPNGGTVNTNVNVIGNPTPPTNVPGTGVPSNTPTGVLFNPGQPISTPVISAPIQPGIPTGTSFTGISGAPAVPTVPVNIPSITPIPSIVPTPTIIPTFPGGIGAPITPVIPTGILNPIGLPVTTIPGIPNINFGIGDAVTNIVPIAPTLPTLGL